jgi:hypothetical protein
MKAGAPTCEHPVITFGELFREGHGLNALDHGAFAGTKAHEVLAETGIAITADINTLTSIQNGSLIGIAFYSLPDLKLLDQLVLKYLGLAAETSKREPIVIFDVLHCKTMWDFDKLIPGIGAVYQTPVVGIWKNGLLTEKATGAEAHSLIARKYLLEG